MKYIMVFFSILFTLPILTQPDYEQIIEQHAQEWKNSYIDTLKNQEHLQTLIDVILLSYQVAKESCAMILAKLIMQEELLNIYTPSLTDSWNTNMQVVNNDTSKIEQAMTTIKQSQIKFQQIFNKLKNIGPRIVQINPQPTKTLISDLKHSLMIWGKQQYEISKELDLIQHEFCIATTTLSDIKIMVGTLLQEPELKDRHLKEAAGYVAKTNKDIESVFAHVTAVRKTSIINIQSFFVTFFQTYYRMLYDLLTPEQQATFTTIVCENEKLPLPDAFFA